MTILFSENITVKYYDEKHLYKSKYRKIKTYDGPNNFSVFLNQLLILVFHNIIYDMTSLKNKFNIEILKYYSNKIIDEIDKILVSDKKILKICQDTCITINNNNIFKKRLSNLKSLLSTF
jgi:hypothetical protein